MLRMPQRSVTRFFIPLIDVLTLLFCIYLLMPIIKPAGAEETADTGAAPADARSRSRRARAEMASWSFDLSSVYVRSAGPPAAHRDTLASGMDAEMLSIHYTPGMYISFIVPRRRALFRNRMWRQWHIRSGDGGTINRLRHFGAVRHTAGISRGLRSWPTATYVRLASVTLTVISRPGSRCA